MMTSTGLFRENIGKYKFDSKCPLYWKKFGDKWYIEYFDRLIKLDDINNYPVIHISWYEAEAFAN